MSEPNVEILPSDQLVQMKTTADITDERGRVITLTKPGVLAQFRQVEMLGQTASNPAYMQMVFPLLFVSAIDGDPVQITTKRELEALIQRLDEPGLMAVEKGMMENWGKQDPDADKAAIKN